MNLPTSRPAVVLATILAALALTGESRAFVRDSHYHLTFGLALLTCFDWDEAHLIASADFMIDRNKTTKSETSLTRKVNKRNWHAFGHDEERLNDLWQRAVLEPDREMALLKFGQFMHFMQDWESHAGYPMGIGHALATISGHDPDSLAKDQARTMQMAQATLDHLGKACRELGRIPESKDADAELLDLTAENRVLTLDAAQHQGLRETCAGHTPRLAGDQPVVVDGPTLKVLTFNTWHGLRGERKTKLSGEDPERKVERIDWQIEQIKALDPDLLLFQEVNKNSRQTKSYAEALGYDYIKKVTSCGIHAPPIKIPSNMNEGLAILARPGLGLRKVGKKRLSGNATCGASYGFQTKESRYVLFGEITVDGESVLVATTHLSSPPYLRDSFVAELDQLVEQGTLEQEQRDEIVGKIEYKRKRNFDEVAGIIEEFEKYLYKARGSDQYRHLILGGDFNTEPDTIPITALRKVGFTNATSDPGFLTWDPEKNHANQAIGGRRKPTVPTFEIPEIEQLLEPWARAARQIDFIFVGPSVTPVTAEMVLDQERDGIYPSDHFGLLSVIQLGRAAPE